MFLFFIVENSNTSSKDNKEKDPIKSKQEMKAALLNFKKDVTKSVLLMMKEASSATDGDTQSVLFNSLSKMTDGGKDFDADTKKDIADSVADMARQKMGLVKEAKKKKRRRRRRDTGDGDSGDGDMTNQDVRCVYYIYVLMFRGSVVKASSLESKSPEFDPPREAYDSEN